LYTMAILSKEIAVTLPFIFLILDVYPLGRLGAPSQWAARTVRSVWLEKIPFFAIGAADSMLALYIGTSTDLIDSSSMLNWTARLSITVYDLAFYLLKTIVPLGLSPLYLLTRYKASLAALPFQLSATAVLLVTWACFEWRRKYPGILAAWIACAITLLPVSGIVHQGFQIAADRYTYLACLGWALVAGAGITFGWRAFEHSLAGRVLLVTAAVAVLFTLSFLARRQIAVWKDSITLWTQAIAVEPSFTAHLNLGSALAIEGDSLGASEQFRKAIALWPENGKGHYNLGTSLLDMGQWDAAAREFRLAIQWQPQPAMFNNLGRALMKQGKLDEAIGAFQEGLRLDPGDQDLQRNLQRVQAMK
jgi:tetratricopeptide (TPR) repeat protein